MIGLLVMTALAILFYCVLINYADSIINLIKIDKGFDDEFIVFGDLKTRQILTLGIILLGGYLLITNLSDVMQYTFLAFKDKVSNKGGDFIFTEQFGSTDDYFNWTYATINVVLGYIFLTNHNRISNWLDKKSTT
jgi:hypothetical protein